MGTAVVGSAGVVRPQSGALESIRTLVAREFERVGAQGLSAGEGRRLRETERFFVDRLDDDDTRKAIRAARLRFESFGAPGDEASSANVLAFAGEAFGICALDAGWGDADAAELTVELSRLLGESVASTGAGLFLSAVRNPQLLALPPRVAVQVQLDLIIAFAPVDAVSLWFRDGAGRLTCVASVGQATRTMRHVAKRVLAGQAPERAGRRMIVGVPVTRWNQPWAALVARERAEDRVGATGFLRGAAATISPVAERDMLLHRSIERERALVDAAEKRLMRLGFDLHDGPLQDLAALADDIRYAQERVVPLVPETSRAVADGRFADFTARIASIDRSLRELSQSLESTSAACGPMERVLEREVERFRNETGVTIRRSIRGDFGTMTRSQKLALFRIVQEALNNVREHSSATDVNLEVVARLDRIQARVEDNGTGFEVSDTLFDAARRGRLGLVGMGERARLLGGKLDIRSCVGGPTVVLLTLPRYLALEPQGAAAPAAI